MKLSITLNLCEYLFVRRKNPNML